MNLLETSDTNRNLDIWAAWSPGAPKKCLLPHM